MGGIKMLSDDELADALEAKGSSQLFHDTEEGELMRQAAQRLRSRGALGDVAGDIRIAIWNAGMKGGMGQDLTQAFIARAMVEPTMKRALSTPAREGVEALLREVRDKGLIYWEPQTQRGTVAKADMLRRIDAALTPTPPTAAGEPETKADIRRAEDRMIADWRKTMDAVEGTASEELTRQPTPPTAAQPEEGAR
jgi:hypothetical protein